MQASLARSSFSVWVDLKASYMSAIKFTFLTANGGVSGSFGTIQSEFATNTIVKAQVVNLQNAVVLEGTQGSFDRGRLHTEHGGGSPSAGQRDW